MRVRCDSAIRNLPVTAFCLPIVLMLYYCSAMSSATMMCNTQGMSIMSPDVYNQQPNSGICGDFTCNPPAETSSWCEDCYCGDGVCDYYESESMACAVDCAASLVVITQPTSITAGLLEQQPSVAIKEATGKYSWVSSTVSVKVVDSGGLLSTTSGGNDMIKSVCGLFSFTDLKVGKSGVSRLLFQTIYSGVTLQAVSVSFSIAHGAAHHLKVARNPGGIAVSTIFKDQPIVHILDAFENIVENSTIYVTASVRSGCFRPLEDYCVLDQSLVLKGGTRRQSVRGMVTYTTLYLPVKSEGVALLFSSGDSILPARSGLLIVANVPHHLEMLASPQSGAAAGEALYPQPSVALRDSSGLLSSWALDDVKCSFGAIVRSRLLCSSPDAQSNELCTFANLIGNKAITAVGGIASFTDLAIDRAGQVFSILFDVACGATGVAPVQSMTFNVSYGMPFKLEFLGSSNFGVTPGCPFAIQPRVMVQDKYGNLVGDAQVFITAILLQDNVVSNYSLLGTLTQKSCKIDTCECRILDGCGTAFWGNLQINVVGRSFSIRFVSANLQPVNSFPVFDIQAGPVYSIFLVRQPSGVWSGLPFKVQPIIGMHDIAGNFVSSNSTRVTAESVVTKAGGAVCSMGGVTSISSSFGMAIFTDLGTPRIEWMEKMCNERYKFKIRFSITQLSPACSSSSSVPVNVVDSPFLYLSAEAALLVITAQPRSMISVQSSVQPLTISFQDQNGTLATWFDDFVPVIEAALCIYVPCPSGKIESVSEMGTPCFVCSNDETSFCQNQSEAAYLAKQKLFSTSGFTGQIQAVASNGECSFTDLMLKKAGTYKLRFAAKGFKPVHSQPFTVVEGPALKLGIARQPALAVPGAAFGIQPIVALLDVGGNVVASQSYITLTAILINADGRADICLATANDVTMISETRFRHGVSEFQGLRVDVIGSYQLIFQSKSLMIKSNQFSVTVGPAFSLSVEENPDGCMFNIPCLYIPIVSVKDAGDNTVLSSTATIIASSISLSCSFESLRQVASAVSGVAFFEGYVVTVLPTMVFDSSCDGSFEVLFTSDNLRPANSLPFLVSSSATRLTRKSSPIFAIPGSSFPIDPVVLVSDDMGRLVRTFAGSVVSKIVQCNCSSISCCTHVAGITLLGQSRVNSDAGLSRFTNLRLDQTGRCYRLLFETGYLLPTLSGSFDVTVGTSTSIVSVLQQPFETDAGTTLKVQPTIVVLDRGLNIRTDLTGQKISVALLAQGNLDVGNTNLIWSSGTYGLSQIAFLFEGQALFTDLRIDSAMCCAVMRFVFNTRFTGYSMPFTVNPGPATHLTILVFPPSAIAGWVFDVQPMIGYNDLYGNNVLPSFCIYECSRLNSQISVEIGSDSQQRVLVGRTLVESVDGIGRYTNLQLRRAGNFTLFFRSNSSFIEYAASEYLVVTSNMDRATRLTVLVQPFGAKATPTTPGSKPIPFNTQPIIAITDLGNNIMSAAQTTVSVSIFVSDVDYTGGLCRGQSNCPQLSGNKSIQTVKGVAAFSDLSVSPPCSGLILLFTSSDGCASSGGACDSEKSLPFDASGAISRMVVVTVPLFETAGMTFRIQPKVRIVDDRDRWYTYSSNIKELISVTILPATKNQAENQQVFSSNNSFFAYSISGKSSIFCAKVGLAMINCSVRISTAKPLDLYGNLTAEYSDGLASFTDLMLEGSNSINAFTFQFTLIALGDFVYTPLTHCCFFVSPAEAEKLELTPILGSQIPGEVIKLTPIIWFLDRFDNHVNLSDANVSASLLSQGRLAPESAFPITGAFAKSQGGIVQFTALSCSRPGRNFSFLFMLFNLHSVESEIFNVMNHGDVFRLQINRSPDGFVEGRPFEIQPIISALDRVDNIVESPLLITVSLLITGPSNVVPFMNGNVTSPTVKGSLAYSDLSISKTGSALYLRFSIVRQPEIFINSGIFDVSTGPSQLKFHNNPSKAAVSGETFLVQPSLRISDFQDLRISLMGYSVAAYLDSFDNPRPCISPKTYRCSLPEGVCAKDAGSCPELMGRTVISVVSGYANFTDLKVGPCNTNSSGDCSRGTYRINFVLNGVLRINYTMVVNVGRVSGLAFKTVQWSANMLIQASGVPFAIQPELYLIDLGGNIVTSETKQIKVSVVPGVFENQWTQLGIDRGLAAHLCSRLTTFCPCISDILLLQQLSASEFSRFSQLLTLFLSRTRERELSLFSRACQCGKQSDCEGTNCSCNPSWFGSSVETSSNGLVKWTNLGIRTSGAQYRLRFFFDSVEFYSTRFDVLFGTAALIQVLINPQRAFAGQPFEVQPSLAMVDIGLNLVLSFSRTVSARLLPNDHNEILQGQTELNFVGGKVRYTNLRIDKVSSCYLIEFLSFGTRSAVSDIFNVSYGTLFSKISIVKFPSGLIPGYPFQGQPIVAILDAGGNVLESFPYLIEVSLFNSTGARNALCSFSINRPSATCGTRRYAINGFAAFTDLRLDKQGKDYRMTFQAIDNLGNIIPVQVANYGPFNIDPGIPFRLNVMQQPSTEGGTSILVGQPGQILARQPSIAMQDAGGNDITTRLENRVTAILYQNGQETALLSFPEFEPPMLLYDPALKDVTLINQIITIAQGRDGIFTFSSLRVDRAAKNYSIRFVSSMMLWAESVSFNVECGPVFKLAISRSPAGFLVGYPFLVQPIITLQDRGGNVVVNSPPFRVVVASLSGPSGAFLTQSSIQSTVLNGYAAFTDLGVSSSGNNFEMTFTSQLYSPAISDKFNVSGFGVSVRIVAQPVGSVAGLLLKVQPIVNILDDRGRLVDSDMNSRVTAQLLQSSNPLNATISGNNIVQCCSGICTFTDLSLTKAGSFFQIYFSAFALESDLSLPFKNGGPVSLQMEQNPAQAISNVSFGVQPIVIVVDHLLNLVSACNLKSCNIGGEALVVASLVPGTGVQEFSALFGTTHVPIIGGRAVFTDLAIQGAGGLYSLMVEPPYSLRFTAVDLVSVDSLFFNITYFIRPPTGYVKAGVRIFGLYKNQFTPKQQRIFISAIMKRLSIGKDAIQIYSISAGTRRFAEPGQHSDIVFYIWSNSSTSLIKMANSLSSWLKRDGALANSLMQEGLEQVTVIILFDVQAFAWDGSILQMEVANTVSSVIGGVVGGFFAFVFMSTAIVIWFRAKQKAKVRNEELREADIMRAIGMQDFSNSIEETALIPWSAEKLLETDGPEEQT